MDFPGSSVVKTLHFQCRGHVSIPGQGIQIPQAAWCVQKKKNHAIYFFILFFFRIMLFKKVTSSSKYNWFWGILVFFPTHWIRIRDRKQSPVHFTCLSIRKNIIYTFNILLWTASLCKVLEYSIFDIHTLSHTHTIWYCRLCQDLFNTREFRHTAYATNPYLLYVSYSY